MTPGHAPDLRASINIVPGAEQVSVPVTVTLEVPCVTVDEEREPLKLHAYAGKRKVAPIIVSTRIERKNKTKTVAPFNIYDPSLTLE
jgi:hypothetical protein